MDVRKCVERLISRRYYKRREVDDLISNLSSPEHDHDADYSPIGHNHPGIVGEIRMYAGATPPPGWILSNGQAVDRSSGLGQLLVSAGSPYGDGDGSTTVNVPNFKVRVPIGPSLSYPLGATGGQTEHTLTEAEMPGHDHTTTDNGVPVTVADGSSGGNYGWIQRVTSSQGSPTARYTLVIEDTGGGQPHNNMQPYLSIQFMIYAGE